MKRILLAAVFLGVLPAASQAATVITQSVVAPGGGTASNAGHLVRFTLGQCVTAGAGSAGHFMWSGFWGPLYGAPVDVPGIDLPIPTAFALLPGRPNPFSRTTTITFEVPREATESSARIRLRVYDMGGRLVCTLYDRRAEPGRFAIEWRGDDETGRPLAAGIYTCVLDTPGGRLTRRAVLLR